MNEEYTPIIIWSAVILTAFGFAWKAGHLRRIAKYVAETREELRKCSWPSRQELKGSTVVVIISSALLGAFTVGIDVVVQNLIQFIL